MAAENNGEVNDDNEFEFDDVGDDKTFANTDFQDCPYDNITIDCNYYSEEGFLDRFATNNKFSSEIDTRNILKTLFVLEPLLDISFLFLLNMIAKNTILGLP